jgi:steroid 5-alpha reductase family enzyme
MNIYGFLFFLVVLGLPALSSYLLSLRVHAAFKKHESTWATTAAVGAFILAYVLTLGGIVGALIYTVDFQR